MFKKLLLTAALGASLIGCAVGPIEKESVYVEDNYVYDPSKSAALNVWNRAQMPIAMQDVELPEDMPIDEAFWDSGTGSIVGAGALYQSGGLAGVSGGFLAGTSILSDVLITDVTEANRVIFFAPKELGETEVEARVAIARMFRVAAREAATEMGWDVDASHENGEMAYAGYSASTNLAAGVANEVTPEGTVGNVVSLLLFTLNYNEGEWVELSNNSIKHGHVKFNSNHRGFVEYNGYSELELLLAISERMPEWFYVYIAPKRLIMDNEGTVNEIPFIVNQGNIELFIKPE